MSIFEYDEERHKKCIREEGFEEGFDAGELSKLVKLVCRKLAKNKTPDIIAEELEEDVETINHICEVTAHYAPDYDVAEIIKHI